MLYLKFFLCDWCLITKSVYNLIVYCSRLILSHQNKCLTERAESSKKTSDESANEITTEIKLQKTENENNTNSQWIKLNVYFVNVM